MGEIKQIDIKNRSYYLYRNLSDLKNFDAEFIKIDKKSDKNILDKKKFKKKHLLYWIQTIYKNW